MRRLDSRQMSIVDGEARLMLGAQVRVVSALTGLNVGESGVVTRQARVVPREFRPLLHRPRLTTWVRLCQLRPPPGEGGFVRGLPLGNARLMGETPQMPRPDFCEASPLAGLHLAEMSLVQTLKMSRPLWPVRRSVTTGVRGMGERDQWRREQQRAEREKGDKIGGDFHGSDFKGGEQTAMRSLAHFC